MLWRSVGHSCCPKVIRFLDNILYHPRVRPWGGSSSEQDRVRRKAKDKSAEQITKPTCQPTIIFGIQETWIRRPACSVFQFIWNVYLLNFVDIICISFVLYIYIHNIIALLQHRRPCEMTSWTEWSECSHRCGLGSPSFDGRFVFILNLERPALRCFV